MKDRAVPSGGEICPCGKGKFKRFARCNESTDGLNIHFDKCNICGFETYAYNMYSIKTERYEKWLASKLQETE